MKLILYSKAGCHLCQGLQEKLEQIRSLRLELEVRDITTQSDWFRDYEYEVPVLFLSPSDPNLAPIAIPRPSPRATVPQLEQMLQKYCQVDRRE